MKKHLQIGNWSHFSGEARQPNGDPRLITTLSGFGKKNWFWGKKTGFGQLGIIKDAPA